MRSISELVDDWYEDMLQRQERNKHLTDEELLESEKQEAVDGFKAWHSQCSEWAQTHKYDAFLSWLDANYPDLYEDHKNEIWRRVNKR